MVLSIKTAVLAGIAIHAALIILNVVEARNVVNLPKILSKQHPRHESDDPLADLQVASLFASSGTSTGPDGQIFIPFSTALFTPVITVDIGVPSESFDLMVDTGSDLTWVRSSLCVVGNDCWTNQPKLKIQFTRAIKGILGLSKHQSIKYGDGAKVHCVIIEDTVAIANTMLFEQSICAATYSSTPIPLAIDGIIGLDSNTDTKSTNIIGKLLESQYPEQQMISFWYDRNVKPIVNLNTKGDGSNGDENMQIEGDGESDDENDDDSDDDSDDNQNGDNPAPLTPNAGEITLGKPNPARYTGEISWLDQVPAEHHWTVQFNSMTIGDQVHNATGDDPTAIIDTGSTLVYLKQELYNAVFLFMDGKEVDGLYELNCSTVTSLPTIVFEFQGVRLPLTWDQQFTIASNNCVSIFMNGEREYNLFGSTFLRQFYTSFDLKENRIGFANLSDAASSLETAVACAAMQQAPPLTYRAVSSSSTRRTSMWNLSVIGFVFSIYGLMLAHCL